MLGADIVKSHFISSQAGCPPTVIPDFGHQGHISPCGPVLDVVVNHAIESPKQMSTMSRYSAVDLQSPNEPQSVIACEMRFSLDGEFLGWRM